MQTSNKKNVLIMQGVSGAGKTTYVNRHYPEAFVVSADTFFIRDDGRYVFDYRLLQEAHEVCWRSFLAAIQQGKSTVVVDNVNATAAEIGAYVLPAESFGYTVQIVTIVTPASIAAKRTLHRVPYQTIQSQERKINHSRRDMLPFWKQTIVASP